MMTAPELQELADVIRALSPGEHRALAEQLAPSAGRPPRCPARDLPDDDGPRVRCVRDEDHALPHVGPGGEEWLVALRCRIGAEVRGPAVCARLDGHEGDCNPLPAPVHVASTPQERRRRRGICQCGRPRQEHAGEYHTGGVEGTTCARYSP